MQIINNGLPVTQKTINKLRSMKNILLILTVLLSILNSSAQEEEIDRWDNWFLIGNKVVFGGKNSFKHSHELQWRVNNNMSTLKEWFYEGVFTYSPNAKWEISPDFRASINPNGTAYRFGLSGVRKHFINREEGKIKGQLVQQVKYQTDLERGNVKHGLRYALTYNHIYSEKFIVSGLIAPFYRWSENFTGIEFIRGGPIFTYIFDPQHTLALAPLVGTANLGGDDGWVWSFTPMVSLIIRIDKDYKYVPAKYINF